MTTSKELTEKVRAYFPDTVKSVGAHRQKEIGLYKLIPNSVIYGISSRLDLDTDGSNLSGDATSQNQTSLRYKDGTSVNSNKVPFYVLPIGFGLGINIGDMGVVWLEDDEISYVIFADRGPRNKFGEASLQTFRELGAERVKPNGRIRDVSLDKLARVLMFPGTGNGYCRPISEINEICLEQLNKL